MNFVLKIKGTYIVLNALEYEKYLIYGTLPK